MSTVVICSKCGGVATAPPGEATGLRRCGCPKSEGGVATATAAPTPKICNVCGADVHGKKRMKDSHGNYWCEPCWQDANKSRPGAGGKKAKQVQASIAIVVLLLVGMMWFLFA